MSRDTVSFHASKIVEFATLLTNLIAQLKNTAQSITDAILKKIILDALENFEIDIEEFEENLKNPIISVTSHQQALQNLNNLIINAQANVANHDPDRHSRLLLDSIFLSMQNICKELTIRLPAIESTNTQPSPLSNSRWEENRLRLEQQLLRRENNTELTKSFFATLEKIGTHGQRQYYLPNGIFICYAWPNLRSEVDQHLTWLKTFLEILRHHLIAAGLATVKLDIQDNPPGGSIYEYMQGAQTADYVLLIGTETLLSKHMSGNSAVCTELININRKRQKDREQNSYRVFPLLLSGNYHHSFPAHYELYNTIRDWKGTKTYFQHLKWLIASLYSTRETAFDAIWHEFLNTITPEENLILMHGLAKDAVLRKIDQEQKEQQQQRILHDKVSYQMLAIEQTINESSTSKMEVEDPEDLQKTSVKRHGSFEISTNKKQRSTSSADALINEEKYDLDEKLSNKHALDSTSLNSTSQQADITAKK